MRVGNDFQPIIKKDKNMNNYNIEVNQNPIITISEKVKISKKLKDLITSKSRNFTGDFQLRTSTNYNYKFISLGNSFFRMSGVRKNQKHPPKGK